MTLRVLSNDSPQARADEAEMEAESLRADMKAAAERLRWVVLTSLWDETPRRRVLRVAERLEAQAEGSEGVA